MVSATASSPASQDVNQCDERLVAWERSLSRECAADELTARALEALRLSLAKEPASGFTRDCDYMKQTQRHGLKDAWRVKICRWMFEVRVWSQHLLYGPMYTQLTGVLCCERVAQTGKAFELSVDTIGCAISYMDQFLCVESVDKVMMQLLSLVCVFVASKIHEPEPITLVRCAHMPWRGIN